MSSQQMMDLLTSLQHLWFIWVRIYLNTSKITPEESFPNAYIEELYESEYVHTDTKLLCVILDAKYEIADLHKVMENQFQHLTMTQCNELLQLFKKNRIVVRWNT